MHGRWYCLPAPPPSPRTSMVAGENGNESLFARNLILHPIRRTMMLCLRRRRRRQRWTQSGMYGVRDYTRNYVEYSWWHSLHTAHRTVHGGPLFIMLQNINFRKKYGNVDAKAIIIMCATHRHCCNDARDVRCTWQMTGIGSFRLRQQQHQQQRHKLGKSHLSERYVLRSFYVWCARVTKSLRIVSICDGMPCQVNTFHNKSGANWKSDCFHRRQWLINHIHLHALNTSHTHTSFADFHCRLIRVKRDGEVEVEVEWERIDFVFRTMEKWTIEISCGRLTENNNNQQKVIQFRFTTRHRYIVASPRKYRSADNDKYKFSVQRMCLFSFIWTRWWKLNKFPIPIQWQTQYTNVCVREPTKNDDNLVLLYARVYAYVGWGSLLYTIRA